MNKTPQRRFSLYLHAYVAVFFALIALIPLWYALLKAEYMPVETREWTGGLVWIASIGAGFWLANRFCSSSNLKYYDGLLHTVGYMIAGITSISFFLVFPALLTVFIASIGLSLWGMIRRDKTYAPLQYHRLIMFFYRHRLRR